MEKDICCRGGTVHADAMEELVAEHRVILEVLAALEQAIDSAEQTVTVPMEFLRTLVTFSQGFVDRCHHGKEEHCLIPCLAGRDVNVHGGIIEEILAEHEEGRALVREITRALDRHEQGTARASEVLEPCRHYVALLRRHIEKEHDVLFPLSSVVMSDADQEDTRECFEQREYEMGEGAHAHLIRLAERLVGRSGRFA